MKNHATLNGSVTLEITRSGSVGGKQRFEVPVPSKHARVLDALNWVRENEDPSLGFRFACRVGMCGTCAVIINDREALACQTTLGKFGERTIRIEPLRGLPVQHDLIVDMQPFFSNLARAEAGLKPREPHSNKLSIIPPASNKRTTIEAHNGCITCGACVSAIADQLQSSDPVGLAALNRLLMLMLEERDSIGAERLGEFIEEVQTLSLQAAEHAESICPADIPLSSALEQLKSFAANYGDNG